MERLVLEFAFRAVLIAVAAEVVLRVLRIRFAAAQHAVWLGVLAAMLALPMWMAWGPKAALRVLPAAVRPAVAFDAAPVIRSVPASPLEAPPAGDRRAPKPPAWSWSAFAIVIYGLGAGVLLLRLAVGAIRAQRLTPRSCAAPVTVGLLRPRVILPECWRDWPRRQLDAVLAHERAHVRRRDPLVEWLALANRALFWFHPLAWWLERKLAALAEEACDAAVLEQGHDPREYSAYLLDLARAVERAGMRVNATAVAMPGSHLPRRIRKMLAGPLATRVSPARTASAAAVLALLTAIFAAGRPERAASPQAALPQAAPHPAAPRFEVASVKQCKGMMMMGGRGGANSSPGRLSVNCLTVADMVKDAYIRFANGERNFLSYTEISGGPSWINAERYEIDATAEGAPSREMMMGPMLQALLEDRFHLKVHRETREVPVYVLTTAKSGPKMPAVMEADCKPFDPSTADGPAAVGKGAPLPCGSFFFGITPGRPGVLSAHGHGIGLDAFAHNITKLLDRPVYDKTGIAGLFDFDVKFASDETTPRFQPGGDLARWGAVPDGASEPLGPRFPAALQQQLGLKLEPAKGPGEFVVIDGVERPSAN